MFYNKTQRESRRNKSLLQHKPASRLKAWILVVFLFCFQISLAQEQDALQELLQILDKAPDYDAQKLERIQKLRFELRTIQESDLKRQYNINHELMYEYAVFKQDSARQNIIMSVFLLFVVALAGVIYLQVRRHRRAKKIIEQAHRELQSTNEKILEINDKLKETNEEVRKVNIQQLKVNKINEEYIGFFISQEADIFEKFRDFKRKVEESLMNDKISKVKFLVSGYNLKLEKEKLLHNFDKAFIKLFPKFIEEFNSLLKPGEQTKVKKDQILNKELRIFALMRLGINQNEVIAQILGYSVNSIYAYKTKIRKKSRLNKKGFDKKLMDNTILKL